jgi:Hemolysins and related proteins containing CBS domains
MEIPLSILFLLIALVFSFFGGVINSLTKEEIITLKEINTKKASILEKIYNNFDERINEFFLFELLFAGFSLSFFINFLDRNYNNLQIYIIANFLIIVLYFFFHYLFYSYGERKSNRFAMKFASILYFVHIIARPFVLLVNTITQLIKGKTENEESINEIVEMVESARDEGALDDDEYRLLKNIMNFSDVLVMDVMTPRTVIFSCSADSTVAEVVNNPGLQTYSRIPVWDGSSLDEKVIGYVLSKDIFKAALNNQLDLKLRSFTRDIYIIPETAQLNVALEKFLKRRQHIFIVVDEYGGISGLITMEDVLETILGAEIMDEADKVQDLRKLASEKRDQRIRTQLI